MCSQPWGCSAIPEVNLQNCTNSCSTLPGTSMKVLTIYCSATRSISFQKWAELPCDTWIGDACRPMNEWILSTLPFHSVYKPHISMHTWKTNFLVTWEIISSAFTTTPNTWYVAYNKHNIISWHHANDLTTKLTPDPHSS